MNISSIDIGSNTVLLLIAEYDPVTKVIRTIRNYYEMPRISEDLKAGSSIKNEKITELIRILGRFLRLSEEFSSEKIVVTGTNAFRIASNAVEVTGRVKRELGIDIKILSGTEEAYLSYLGSLPHPGSEKEHFVVDIGGGSTELIYGKGAEIKFDRSTPIGVVSLSQEFFAHDPPLETEISRCSEKIRLLLKDMTLPNEGAFETTAVAGTPTTLICIKNGVRDYDPGLVEGAYLTQDEIFEILTEMKILSGRNISERYGKVTEGREDLLIAGTLVLYNIAAHFGIEKIRVSNRGLRYGAILAE